MAGFQVSTEARLARRSLTIGAKAKLFLYCS